MRPLADFDPERLRTIRAVLTDFDDTLTRSGLFPAASVAAIENLAASGIACVIVSGRPAGWCDLLARMLPLAAVIGENGAITFAYDRTVRKMKTIRVRSAEQLASDRAALSALAAEIIAAVPGSAVAADQPWRIADLAIDFAEDTGPLNQAAISKIAAMFAAAGAKAKISSIHVNGWFGEHDKLSTTRQVLPELLGLDPDRNNGAFAYLGDSPNDEPMFEFFENSIGVANIRDFKLEHPPKWVTVNNAADGFCEFADLLLRTQKN